MPDIIIKVHHEVIIFILGLPPPPTSPFKHLKFKLL